MEDTSVMPLSAPYPTAFFLVSHYMSCHLPTHCCRRCYQLPTVAPARPPPAPTCLAASLPAATNPLPCYLLLWLPPHLPASLLLRYGASEVDNRAAAGGKQGARGGQGPVMRGFDPKSSPIDTSMLLCAVPYFNGERFRWVAMLY